jgi:hypothetical protein
MIALTMMMRHVLREQVAEMSLAEGNDAMQALGLHGSHEAFEPASELVVRPGSFARRVGNAR